ncbi:MAG: DMT family transporter [archaeon]
MRTKTKGVLAIIVSACIWSIQAVFAKHALETRSVIHLLAVLTLMVTLATGISIVASKKQSFRISKKHLIVTVLTGLIAGVFSDVLYFHALKTVPVLNAMLIAHLQVVVILLLGFIFLKGDRLTKFDLGGMVLLMFSAAFVSSRSLDNLLGLRLGTHGDLLVFFAMFGWAVSATFIRRDLTTVHETVSSFYRFLVLFPIFIVILLVRESILPPTGWEIAAGLCSISGFLLYMYGIRRIKAAQVASLELTAPLFGLAMGFLFLGEGVTMFQMVGILFLIPGILLLARHEDLPPVQEAP